MDDRDMPRERLLALGVEALSDAELVAIHLGTGRRGEHVLTLARALLGEFGGVAGLGRARAVGLRFLDHVVVTDHDWRSVTAITAAR